MKTAFYRLSPVIGMAASGVLARLYAGYIVRPFNGDSAVFALMGRHILELKEMPIYMPLAHYAGSLSSYIAAALFGLFGASYGTYIVVGILFSCAWMAVSFALSRRMLDGLGRAAADLCAAIPALPMVYYSLSTGILSESFLFITVILLAALSFAGTEDIRRPALFFGGMLSGLALWTSPSTVPAVLTLGAVVVMKKRRAGIVSALGWFGAGLLIGHAPALIYNIQHPGASLFRMAGRVLDLDRSVLSDPAMAAVVLRKAFWRMTTVPASLMRMPVLTAGMIGIPACAVFFASIAVAVKDCLAPKTRAKWMAPMLTYVFLSAAFYAIFVGERSPRYAAPLSIVSPFFIGYGLSRIGRARRVFIAGLAAALVLYNVSTLCHPYRLWRADRYGALSEWLVKHGISAGVSDYDTAYAVQFLSSGKALISPTIFHPTFADRWPAQTAQIKESPEAVYIVDMARYPDAGAARQLWPALRAASYRQYRVGDFAIYRALPAGHAAGKHRRIL